MILRKKPLRGDLYACVVGDHAGKFLIFMERNVGNYGFLEIPTMENLWVPINKFDFGLDYGIIEFIERVPDYVKETSEVKFKENQTTV